MLVIGYRSVLASGLRGSLSRAVIIICIAAACVFRIGSRRLVRVYEPLVSQSVEILRFDES